MILLLDLLKSSWAGMSVAVEEFIRQAWVYREIAKLVKAVRKKW